MCAWKVSDCGNLKLQYRERVGGEQHCVDEINLLEKFQSIGIGDPKRRWLVDRSHLLHHLRAVVVTPEGCLQV